MKKTIQISILVFGFINAGAALADTPLKMSGDVTRIHGTARPSAKISALVFYTPLANYDKKLSDKDCVFSEDHWSANGNERGVTLKVDRAATGAYSVSVPVKGQRGKCPYVVDAMYLSFEDGPVNQSMSFVSDLKLKKDTAELGDLAPETPVPSLTTLPALYCELRTTEEMGFCEAAQGPVELTYSMTSTPADYVLNIKDKSEQPERQY